ncbi:MAG: hypothetical protein R3A10_02395 [Caldilineaceae bacterium]
MTGPNVAVPVTLYWQTLSKTDRRYKYVLRLEERTADGGWQPVTTTEREPYDGVIPTAVLGRGHHRGGVQRTDAARARLPAAPDRYRLTLQMYDGGDVGKVAGGAQW